MRGRYPHPYKECFVPLPNQCGTSHLAILRLTFGDPKKKAHDLSKQHQQNSNKLLFQQLQSHFNQQQLHVYTMLSRQQVLELREVRGGDEMRMNYLCEKLGIKLVGRKGLGPTADSVIASIKAERGNRKPISKPNSASSALKPGMSKLKAGIMKRKMIRKAKVLNKSHGPIPPSSTNFGGDKVSGDVSIMVQNLPDVLGAGKNSNELSKQ